MSLEKCQSQLFGLLVEPTGMIPDSQSGEVQIHAGIRNKENKVRFNTSVGKFKANEN